MRACPTRPNSRDRPEACARAPRSGPRVAERSPHQHSEPLHRDQGGPGGWHGCVPRRSSRRPPACPPIGDGRVPGPPAPRQPGGRREAQACRRPLVTADRESGVADRRERRGRASRRPGHLPFWNLLCRRGARSTPPRPQAPLLGGRRPTRTPHLRSLLEHLGEARGLGDVERHGCAAGAVHAPTTEEARAAQPPGNAACAAVRAVLSQAGPAPSGPWPEASREEAAPAARTPDDPRSGRSVRRSQSTPRLSARAVVLAPDTLQWTRWVFSRVERGAAPPSRD